MRPRFGMRLWWIPDLDFVFYIYIIALIVVK